MNNFKDKQWNNEIKNKESNKEIEKKTERKKQAFKSFNIYRSQRQQFITGEV